MGPLFPASVSSIIAIVYDRLLIFFSDDHAIQTLRAISPTFPLYIHDGFDLKYFSDWVSKRTDFVVQDNHSYFVFSPQDAAEPASQHTNDVQTGVADRFVRASNQERRNLSEYPHRLQLALVLMLL